MKMIVTGATGFIGMALCEELLKRGHEVAAVIRPGSTKREKLHDLESVQAAPVKFKVLEAPLDGLHVLEQEAWGADVFFHLAWNGAGGTDREDFDVQYMNIRYTVEAVRAAAKCGCRKFVGAGSQAEYGVVRETSKEEVTVPQPFMMYGAAKLAAYHMGRLEAEKRGISFVWSRIYSVYGVGENPGTLVNYVMDSLLSGEIPQLSACENMWNFMYITDCVRALSMLGEREGTEGIYHVASEDSRILREFVGEIRDIIAPGSELAFGVKESNPKRTFWLAPDTDRLKSTGFNCKISFREGINRKCNGV